MFERLNENERKIISRYREDIPVNIFALCKALGVGVDNRKDMPEDLSGFILKEDDKYHIFCNGNEPHTRRRFTVAHELAHYLLHRDQLGDKYPENVLLRGGLSNKEETEANKLAAGILMPYSKIDESIDKGNDKFSIPELADIFDVSKQAMSIRLGIPMDI